MEIERSSGNVFADLRVPEPEGHKLKAALVSKLVEITEEAGWTQTRTAEVIGISQPDLSRIFRGRFRDVSVERLIRALRQLGYEVAIDVSQHGRPVGDPIHLEAMAD